MSNVVVVQKTGLHIYTIGKWDGTPAIKVREPLLRAADGVEEPKPEEWMLTGDDAHHSGEDEEALWLPADAHSQFVSIIH